MISGKLHSAGEHSDTFLRDVEGGEPKDSVDLEPAWTSEVYQDGGHGSDKPISSRQRSLSKCPYTYGCFCTVYMYNTSV